MKFKSLFALLSFLYFGTNISWGQFEPDYSNNYFEEKSHWIGYFDSVRAVNYANGDTTMVGTGFKEFTRWCHYWDKYVPNTGSFDDAKEVYKQLYSQKQKQHFEFLQSQQSSSTSISGLVDWEEIGPNNSDKIYSKKINTNDQWERPHVDGLWGKFEGHMGMVTNIIVHPDNDNIIYACGEGSNGSSGGLFVSYDTGYNWNILNTDQIPNCDITSFEVKPASQAPLQGTDILYLGLRTGAVYRSINNGQTWLEAGYSTVGGVNTSYPYDYTTSQLNSLPYGIDYINFMYSKVSKNNKMEFAPSSVNGGKYQSLLVAQHQGLYRSVNYDASIGISGNTISNNVVWEKIDLTSILSTSTIPYVNSNASERDFS